MVPKLSVIAPELIEVPAGTLAMGSTLEEVERCVATWSDRLIEANYRSRFRSWIMKEFPRHDVPIAAFTAWKYPITNGDFQAYVADTEAPVPESLERGFPKDHPVWGVSIDEAQAFADWCSRRDGWRWRLPSEAEWEWMAAGPRALRYPFGARFDSSACNTVERGLERTTAVNAHPNGSSWCGVMDLAGNVEEWTSDRYAPYPGGEFIHDDLSELVGPNYPIVRGGSFRLGGDLTRSARRHGPHPGPLFRFIGFRLVANGHEKSNS